MMNNDDIASRRKQPPITTLEVVRRANAVVEALDSLYIAMDRMDKQTYGMTMVDLFAKTREPFEAIEDALKKSTRVREFMATVRIPEWYMDQGVTSQTIDGRRVSVSTKMMASMNAARKEEAIQWLKDNGFESIPQETVHAGTLSSAAKEELKSKNIDFPPDLFETFFKETVSVTKVAAKK